MNKDFDTIRNALETARSDAGYLGGEPSAKYVDYALEALDRADKLIEGIRAEALKEAACQVSILWAEYQRNNGGKHPGINAILHAILAGEVKE